MVSFAKKREASLLLTLKPSMRLKRFMIIIHGLALGACISNSLPIIFKCILFTGISLHLGLFVMRLKSPERTIKYAEALGWEVSLGDDFEAVKVLPSTVITIFAIFLHISRQNRDNYPTLWGASKKIILILSDTLTEDEYRCFIVKLKTTAIKQQTIVV